MNSVEVKDKAAVLQSPGIDGAHSHRHTRTKVEKDALQCPDDCHYCAGPETD
ncbi:hypothetical protein R5O87_18150 [Arthrobacter globiformis]|uniref:hypothetical protein n=1 Tax=Arthrobacter globiformis TaxID=1665 RepID=UPI00397820C6